jgi:hypothetical protein
VRISFRRGIAVTAATALVLAGCGDDEAPDDQAAPEEMDAEDLEEDELDDLLGDQEDMEDPNEDVEDGEYRGNGVILPVPDGWSLDPTAFAQGALVAMSEDGTQQLSAQAVDVEEAAAAGQDLDFDTLLDGARQMGEADVDEEVELEGAERAHRLTYLNLPAQQEGQPEQSGTIILAEDGNGLVAEFAFGAMADDYDEEYESILLETAGFDPDSEPPEMPAMPQPAPEGEGGDMEAPEGGEMEAPEDDG